MCPLGLLSAVAFIRCGFCPPGLLSVGAFIRWGFYPWGFFRRGFCPWGFCPRGFCPRPTHLDAYSSYDTLNYADEHTYVHSVHTQTLSSYPREQQLPLERVPPNDWNEVMNGLFIGKTVSMTTRAGNVKSLKERNRSTFIQLPGSQ